MRAGGARPGAPRGTASAAERKFLDESVASIEDPALRKAILALGEAVLTTDES